MILAGKLSSSIPAACFILSCSTGGAVPKLGTALVTFEVQGCSCELPAAQCTAIERLQHNIALWNLYPHLGSDSNKSTFIYRLFPMRFNQHLDMGRISSIIMSPPVPLKRTTRNRRFISSAFFSQKSVKSRTPQKESFIVLRQIQF